MTTLFWAAITACEEANVEIPMIGLDGNPEAERNVAAGGMFKADVAQAAHDIGTITIETIMSHLNGQSVDADILVCPQDDHSRECRSQCVNSDSSWRKRRAVFPPSFHENVKGENPLEALIQAKNISKSFSGIPSAAQHQH